jgi:hypothetical protein
MPRYEITLAGPPMGVLGFGSVPASWVTTVEAADEAAAVEIARARCAEKFDREYATGKATVEISYDWKIVLRGRSDKRRRETFYSTGVSENDAVERLGRSSDAAMRFAGYGLMETGYVIHRNRRGCAIELRGVVVAITTGSYASARTLIGQADFRAEVEAWLAEVEAGV